MKNFCLLIVLTASGCFAMEPSKKEKRPVSMQTAFHWAAQSPETYDMALAFYDKIENAGEKDFLLAFKIRGKLESRRLREKEFWSPQHSYRKAYLMMLDQVRNPRPSGRE